MALADPGIALVRGTHLRQHQLPGQERNEVEGPDENKWERSEGDFAWRELSLLWYRQRRTRAKASALRSQDAGVPSAFSYSNLSCLATAGKQRVFLLIPSPGPALGLVSF